MATMTDRLGSIAQAVTDGGLRFLVPSSWPVYTLASDPNRCIRLDQHAVYLGQEGPAPQCPATIVGHTETVQVQPLNAASQTANSVATQSASLNGLNVRMDPNAGIAGVFTVVFPDQGLVATVTFTGSFVLANQIVQSFQHAS